MASALERALSDLANAIRGGLQVTQRSGDRSADVFFGTQGSITGTNVADVWDPGASKRYVLKGFAITAIVRTTLAATSNHAIFLRDSGTNTPVVLPLGAYIKTQVDAPVVGTDFASPILTGGGGPYTVDLGEGIRGTALASKLQFAAGNDLGSGVIRYTCWVRGTLETI